MARVFKLEVRIEGAAFADAPAEELARILREAASRLEHWGELPEADSSILDVNGNRAGWCGVRRSR